MEKFDAKGQVIFVEPSWVTGETCLFFIKNSMEYAMASSKLAKIRKEFLLRLEKEGFIITFDRNYDKDTICLTMDGESFGPSITENEYIKCFNECIAKSGGDKFNYPKTLNVEQYFENPFFPAVFKNTITNGGVDKFLIENQEQLNIIKRLYLDHPELKCIFDNVIFQQVIDTPTKYKTYLRVLIGASGDVLGASLKYSKIEYGKKELKGIFEKLFWTENSPYYMNCESMFNYYSGGDNITFSQPRYSDEKMDILEQHGIDPNNPEIPEDVMSVAKSIMEKCNPQLGVICGMDFILNRFDNKWYYLENQAFPAIEEWANEKGIRISKGRTIDDYIKYLTLELEVRHEALLMCMNKKLSNDNMLLKQKY